MQDDLQALAEFRHRIRGFIHFSEQAAQAVGLTPQQHQVLLAIQGRPPGQAATIGYLAERLHIRHHSTVELVNRLELRGLVRRQQDPDDQRRVHVIVTARGMRLLKKLTVEHQAELQSVGPALIRTLQRLISRHKT